MGTRFADLEDGLQLGDSQYFAHLLGWIQQREIDTGSLQRNQTADSSSIDGINPREIKGHVTTLLPNSRAQNGSLIASHNSSVTLQNHSIIRVFDGHSKHDWTLPKLAPRARKLPASSHVL